MYFLKISSGNSRLRSRSTSPPHSSAPTEQTHLPIRLLEDFDDLCQQTEYPQTRIYGSVFSLPIDQKINPDAAVFAAQRPVDDNLLAGALHHCCLSPPDVSVIRRVKTKSSQSEARRTGSPSQVYSYLHNICGHRLIETPLLCVPLLLYSFIRRNVLLQLPVTGAVTLMTSPWFLLVWQQQNLSCCFSK